MATVVTVVGAAGVGKTELLRYAVESAHARVPAFRVVSVRADEFDGELPITVLARLIDLLGADLNAIPLSQREALSAVLSGAGGDASATVTLGVALLNLIAEASRWDRPLLIIVDDAHWLDPFSTQVLEIVLRLLHAEPVAMVLAARMLQGPLLDRGTTLEITGLPPDDCARLLSKATLGRPGREVTAELAKRTHGNPLALNEAARLLSGGQLAGREPLPDPLPIGQVGMALVGPSISALPPATRCALVVAALAGSASQIAVPAALPSLGLDIADLDPAITAGVLTSAGWTFRHPLYGAAVVDLTPPAELRRVHRVLADVFRDCDAVRYAHHLGSASGGVHSAAADAMERAALITARRAGPAAAAQLWRSAVELSPPGEARVRRLLAACEAQTAVGQRDQARLCLDELAVAPLSAADLARAARTRSALLPWSRDMSSDLHALEEASAALASGEPLAAADICMNLALVGFTVGSESLVMRQVDLIDEYTRGYDVPHLVASWLRSFSLSLFRGVSWDPEVAGLLDPAARRYLVSRMPLMCAGLAQGLIWIDHRDLAARMHEELVLHLRGTGELAQLAYPLTTAAELGWWAGEWDQARFELVEGIELASLLDQEGLLGFSWALKALFAAAAGEHDDFDESVLQATIRAEAVALSPVGLYIGRARIHDALVHGRYVEAVRTGELLHENATRMGILGIMQVPYLAEYAEAAVLAHHSAAPRLVEEFRSRSEQAPSPWGRSVSLRLQAMSTPSLRESREHFEDALMLLPADHMPFEHARTRQRYAEREARAGNVDVSREQSQRVIAVYDLVGATAWHDCCAMSVRPGGARPLDRRSVKRLTPQQKRVCGLIARGATNREAAELLFLSTKTIEYHVSAAMKVLGAVNRTDLTRRFLESRASAESLVPSHLPSPSV